MAETLLDVMKQARLATLDVLLSDTDKEHNHRRNEAIYENPAGKALRDTATKFEPLFSDMLPEGAGFSLKDIVICPNPYLASNGSFQPIDLEIDIRTTTGKKCGPILLHEMTHLYALVMRITGGEEYETALLPKLEAQARKTLPDLDNIRDSLFDELAEFDRYPDEVDHDDLFLYKSLELDRKRRYKPGTVFGYGLQDAIPIMRKEEEALKEAIRKAKEGAQPWQPR